MRILSTCHSDSAALVLQPVIRFVLDGRLRCLLLHIGSKTPALNHEVIDDAMENSVVIEAARHV